LKSAFCISLSLIFALSACTPQKTRQPSDVIADSFFSGRAYWDANNNGEKDDADTPLEGATFIARDDRGAEFGALTDSQGAAFITFPGGSRYPVTLRMEHPKESPLLRVDPAEIVLQTASGDNFQFLFFSP
jgi:hypothetical protein